MKRRSLLAALPALALASRLGSAAPAGPRWITLGTSGGPQVQRERAQIANALIVADAVYLFDCGNDVQRQLARAGIPERAIRVVFLSHHHLDHNADLGPVLMTHWLFGAGHLPVYGPPGTATLVAGLCAANAPTALASYPTAGPARPAIADTVTAHDLPADAAEPVPVFRDEHITVTAIAVDHYQTAPSVPLPERPRAVAFRIEAGGRSFVYSGDTGPSPGLQKLAQGADVLVSEIVDIDGIAERLARTISDVPAAARKSVADGMKVNHLTAENLGRIAQAAGVKSVVLTHFVPVPEQLRHPAVLIAGVRRFYHGPVHMARDLDSFR
ncbi:MAG: MBL fold metallo-hydrolase [Sphingomonadales bacterium]|nr:MBL fold metallo-hydrolase [Sphingomonadales bacterium]